MTSDSYDAIRRGISMPVYAQLAAILRADIESGRYQPGLRLPSRLALGQEYGVSDISVTKAIALLRQDGMAETTKGLGTYVTDRSRWKKR